MFYTLNITFPLMDLCKFTWTYMAKTFYIILLRGRLLYSRNKDKGRYSFDEKVRLELPEDFQWQMEQQFPKFQKSLVRYIYRPKFSENSFPEFRSSWLSSRNLPYFLLFGSSTISSKYLENFSFNQKFRKLRNGQKWYEDFLRKFPENAEIVEFPKS